MFKHWNLEPFRKEALVTAKQTKNMYAYDKLKNHTYDFFGSINDLHRSIYEAYINNDLENMKSKYLDCDFEVIYQLFLQSIRDHKVIFIDLFMKTRCLDVWKSNILEYSKRYLCFDMLREYYSRSSPELKNTFEEPVVEEYFESIKNHDHDVFDKLYSHVKLFRHRKESIRLADVYRNSYAKERLEDIYCYSSYEYYDSLLEQGHVTDSCSRDFVEHMLFKSILENKLDILKALVNNYNISSYVIDEAAVKAKIHNAKAFEILSKYFNVNDTFELVYDDNTEPSVTDYYLSIQVFDNETFDKLYKHVNLFEYQTYAIELAAECVNYYAFRKLMIYSRDLIRKLYKSKETNSIIKKIIVTFTSDVASSESIFEPGYLEATLKHSIRQKLDIDIYRYAMKVL